MYFHFHYQTGADDILPPWEINCKDEKEIRGGVTLPYSELQKHLKKQ